MKKQCKFLDLKLKMIEAARLAQSVKLETLNLRVVRTSPTLDDQILDIFTWLICSLNPSVSCPGIDLVNERQKGFPVVWLMAGKKGSPWGTGIGRHSGWTVSLESHSLHIKMESPNPLKIIKKVIFKFLLMSIHSTDCSTSFPHCFQKVRK